MPFRYLDDIATADVAFLAWGESCEEMFVAAADATLSVMIQDIALLGRKNIKSVTIQESQLDILLLKFLEEIVYFKDAEALFLRPETLSLRQGQQECILEAKLSGETIDSQKHTFLVDIKAVTLHCLSVKETPQGWQATFVLDI